MDADRSKRLIRQVIKQVHPDLFTDHPEQRARNSESLKALNAYVERIGRGGAPGGLHLEFWVRDPSSPNLAPVVADLPPGGALEPLFYCFGLINDSELAAALAGGAGRGSAVDTDFIAWLRETVGDAVALAERHEDMKTRIREARAEVEAKYSLASLQVGSEFSATAAEQQRQLETLRVLDAVLSALMEDEGADFTGLHFHAYHPDAPPLGDAAGGPSAAAAAAVVDGGGYVSDDGCLHVVADRHVLRDALAGLDLERARVLTRVAMFWLRRVRELSPPLAKLLGVQNVWCDTRTEQNSQNFVIWAGYILEQRGDIETAVAGRRFTFSLLVHSDATSPMIDFSAKSSILQVRSDCPPRQLVEFLVSDGSAMADAAAVAVVNGQAEEQALLEQVRAAFGAKHVVRVASSGSTALPGAGSSTDAVLDGARRLLESAPAIRASGIDLTGASIAIDDCYEVWGSGFISIPYDFELKDLQPQLTRLLGAGGGGGGGEANGGGAVGAEAAADGGSGGARQHNTVAAGAAAGGRGSPRGAAAAAAGAWVQAAQAAAPVPRRLMRRFAAPPVAMAAAAARGVPRAVAQPRPRLAAGSMLRGLLR